MRLCPGTPRNRGGHAVCILAVDEREIDGGRHVRRSRIGRILDEGVQIGEVKSGFQTLGGKLPGIGCRLVDANDLEGRRPGAVRVGGDRDDVADMNVGFAHQLTREQDPRDIVAGAVRLSPDCGLTLRL